MDVHMLEIVTVVLWLSSTFTLGTTHNQRAYGPMFDPTCHLTPEDERFDCHPDLQPSKEQCEKRGCCWIESATSVPSCFYPKNYQGYSIEKTQFGPSEIIIRLLKKKESGFPDDIQHLIVNCTFLNQKQLRVTIEDALHERYRVILPNNLSKLRNTMINHTDYKVILAGNNLLVLRVTTQKIIFSLSLSQMIYADQMIQVSVTLPSHFVYGIGDTKSPLLKSTNWTKYILFARDRPPIENMNLYSSHPFYLVMEDGVADNTGNCHGVLLLNSNAMEVLLQPTPAITFRTIGGIVDFLIYLGPSPADVVTQHTSTIGFTFMPPYWSLGFHLSRLGYNSVKKTREVMNRNRKLGIPIDVQWNDIDYMNLRNDFTLNPNGFQELPSFVNELHEQGMHYIMIVDPGISGNEPRGTYPPLDDGLAMDVFLKNSSGDVLYGKAWNKQSTVYPDFTHPNINSYYTKQFKNFHDVVAFDGAWLDMNEPTNFVNGSLQGCPEDNKLDHPPFVPGHIEPVYTQTVCMSASQTASSHYNVHNLYGTTHAIATNVALRKVRGKRPFIISRSTFPGQGHYAGTWDGDVYSNWDQMRWTIPSILSLNMYGISVSGADICGFNDNTTAELCARWTALGSFYPFSRNHNSDDTIEQDPYILGPDVVKSAVRNLNIRYFLLPYLYTLMFLSHTEGSTVARALFFEFPLDKKTYGIDRQFMWGSSLMIIPVLEEGARKVEAYIPAGTWYDGSNGKVHQGSIGTSVTFYTDIHNVNILIRGGHIIPGQKQGMTTTESRKNAFTLTIALGDNQEANGMLYWDDGDTVDAYGMGLYNSLRFSVLNRRLTLSCFYCGLDIKMTLGRVDILGLTQVPKSVTLDGTRVQCDFLRPENYLSCLNLNGSMQSSVMTW